MEFKTITFKNFQFKPIKFQYINDINVYVVLYELNYGRHKTIVPYYISNGHTNKLRANMLFPFMCISFKDSFCPKKKYKSEQHLLIKYQLISNLNLTSIYDDIEKELGIHLEKEKIGNMSCGLKSVLTRIKNLLDFIICISHIIVKDDIRYYRPVKKNKENELNMDFLEDDTAINNDDNVRHLLINKLITVYTCLSKFLEIENTNLEIESIDTKTFNSQKFISVCGSERTKNKMIEIYIYISSKFNEEFTKLDEKYQSNQKLLENNVENIKKNFRVSCEKDDCSPKRNPSPKRRTRSRSPKRNPSPKRRTRSRSRFVKKS